MRSIMGLVVALPLVGVAPHLAPVPALAQAREVANLRGTTGVRPEPGSVLRQTARLEVNDVSLATALIKLSEASKVNIAFSPNTLPESHRVSCSCRSTTVAAALDHLLGGTSFGYVVLDDQVLVSRRPAIETEAPYVPSVAVAALDVDAKVHRIDAVVPAFLTGRLPSQPGRVGGTVFDAKAMRPLADVQVSVVGATSTTRTDARGRFLIENITSSTASLRLVAVGYRPLTQSVSVGDLNLRLLMEESPLKLDELVVTGTPSAVQRRSLGNAVATINAASVLDEAPGSNVSALINGRAAGVVVSPGTGVVGSGGTISIRGKGSLSLDTQPLVYIDGIRVDNNAFSGPNLPATQAISRINDVNPQDIESIQIIKGPAAATIYGTEAAKGVIQIITKKGKAGATSYDVTVDQGANWFMDPEGRMPTNYARNAQGQVISANVTQLEAAAGRPIFVGSPGTELEFAL